MNKLLDAMNETCARKTTTNSAPALKSTLSNLVDFYGTMGSMRTRDEDDIRSSFVKAFSENHLLGTKLMFHLRNIRGGLGERRSFRIALKELARINPQIVSKNLDNIIKFGRYDDLYTLIGTEVEAEVWKLFKTQLFQDLKVLDAGEPVSLLAKWLKSENATSVETKRLARITSKNLGLSRSEYRKILTKLRKHLDVTEVKMCKKDWTSIKYAKVPSRATSKYRKAFERNDQAGFDKFMDNIANGTEEIKASTLFPYEIFRGLGLNTDYSNFRLGKDKVLEAQWKALPNYVPEGSNVLVMADTSSSMTSNDCLPLLNSLSFAVYFAERNVGEYHNKFITFSSRPSFVTLKGETLQEKVTHIPSIVDNTNMRAAFELLLNSAKRAKVTPEEMPKSVLVISDMQFDYAMDTRYSWTFYDGLKQEFADAGYEIPNVVFWNVNASDNTFHVFCSYKGVQLASGSSPSVFKTIMDNIGTTPYEAMINTLNQLMYDSVTI